MPSAVEKLASGICFDGETELVLRRHTAAICWTVDNCSSPVLRRENNGTCCFVETAQKRFVVTAAHVWNGYDKFKKANPSATLWLAFGCVDSLMTPIFPFQVLNPKDVSNGDSQDRLGTRLDLATFSFEGIAKLDAWRFCHLQLQGARIKVGDPVAFIGFPGDYLRAGSTRRELRHISYGRTVADVGWTQFVLHDCPSKTRLTDRNGKSVPPVRTPGISGAPVFRHNQAGKLALVGFVSRQVSCGMSSPHAEVSVDSLEPSYELSDGDIYVTHARFVSSDGSIQST